MSRLFAATRISKEFRGSRLNRNDMTGLHPEISSIVEISDADSRLLAKAKGKGKRWTSFRRGY
jgi:hypothetical protein